jgi:TRAP-type mannitol/chloroaromatic compound transport system permease small subunit
MGIRKVVKICDTISDWVGGKIFSWFALPIAIMVLYEVISRRVFNNPHMWALDICTMIYGIHFMMVGSYGLLKGAHVNVDTIYMHLSRRWQAALDTAGYILFFFPYFLVFLYVGWDLSIESIQMGDKTVSGVPVIIPAMKTVIWVSALFMLIQGIAEFIRCIYALKTGKNLNDKEDLEFIT